MTARGEACAPATTPVSAPWLASCIWIMIISFGAENKTCASPARPPLASSKPIGSLPTERESQDSECEGNDKRRWTVDGVKWKVRRGGETGEREETGAGEGAGGKNVSNHELPALRIL
eukprot:2301929-Rhodomonas_salina.12